MIRKVLKEIYNSNIFSTSIIAKNLNISEPIVAQLVEELIRMGYLTNDNGHTNCNEKCIGCSMKGFCSTIPIKTLSITDKGYKILSNVKER